jgi:hypothetical protein
MEADPLPPLEKELSLFASHGEELCETNDKETARREHFHSIPNYKMLRQNPQADV